MNRPSLSVVIVARDAARTIGLALESLCRGTVAPDEFIVVDGLSTDRTAAIAQRFPVRVVANPRRQISPGRNVGLRAARGEVIAYTDADCVVAPDWTERLITTFRDEPDLVGIGGKMLALPPANDIEAFAGDIFLNQIMRYGDLPYYFGEARVPGAIITANCAYRRQAVLEQGGFDEWFANCAEDIDLFWRLIENGCRLKYDPDIIVYHSFPRDMKTVCAKHFGFGIASSKLTKRHRDGIAIDLQLYKRWLGLSAAVVTGRSKRRWGIYGWCQLTMHLLGKYYGSLTTRCINL